MWACARRTSRRRPRTTSATTSRPSSACAIWRSSSGTTRRPEASRMQPHRSRFRRLDDDRGVALIATLLIIMLMSALLVGFTTAITSDQKYRLVDRDRVRAFYAAHSGLE